MESFKKKSYDVKSVKKFLNRVSVQSGKWPLESGKREAGGGERINIIDF